MASPLPHPQSLIHSTFMKNTFAIPILCAAIAGANVRADEYADLVNSFGTVTNVIGVRQTTTNNPDGTGINFWVPAFEGAPASAVALSNPHMAAADAFGNLYIADKTSHAVLKITPDGLLHTFAGTHAAGFNGDGPAPANTLQLNNPNGLFVFPDGTVYLLDPGNKRVRRVGTDGIMTTIVTDPEPDWYPSGRALWVSPDRQLIYYTNEFAPVPPSLIADGACVKKWTAAGGIELVCQKSVGFRNPGNIAVNPVDGKLYVTDRAEDDATFGAQGLFRIDGPDARTRITGNGSQSTAAEGQLAINSFIQQPRGLAFLPNGSYFICGHKDGSVWFVDTAGVLHRYLRGRGTRDYYNLTNVLHPPLTGLAPNGQEWFSQPRAVTIAPNGNLICVSNDSGFVFVVNNVATPQLPKDFHPTRRDGDGLHLNWSGIFGHGYLVQRSTDLIPANWQIIGAAGGTATALEFIDPSAGSLPHAFYRLAPSL